MTAALHTDALGTLQVKASLHNNVLGATLSADRPETHAWLATEMPGLQQTLTRQFQVGSMQLSAQLQHQSGSPGGGGSAPQTPARPASASALAPPVAAAAAPVMPEPALAAAGGGRLNLRV
jgi:hypothetical protein